MQESGLKRRVKRAWLYPAIGAILVLAASSVAIGQSGSETAPATPTVPASPPSTLATPQCYSRLPAAARTGGWTCVEDYVIRVRDQEGRVLENTPTETRLIGVCCTNR